ncbi:MAG: hypothetical protein ACRD0W_05745 [Acidimicrobiales bacterium]
MCVLGRWPKIKHAELYEALGEVARRAQATASCGLRIGAPDDPTVCYSCGRRLEDHQP